MIDSIIQSNISLKKMFDFMTIAMTKMEKVFREYVSKTKTRFKTKE